MSERRSVGRHRTLDTAMHITAGRPVLTLVLSLTTLFSLAPIGGGIWLIVLGASGNTEFSLFGNNFKSQNVGIAAFFCGAVVFALSIRRTLKALERLAALPTDTMTPTASAGATLRTDIYPDWGIRELFFHIRSDLIDEPDKKRWESVGREVMDHFSTGRLKAWGRPIYGSRKPGPMKLVDEPGYWGHAEFSYWFLKEDGRENRHTWVKSETKLPDYADIQVNRAEAMPIWPESGLV